LILSQTLKSPQLNDELMCNKLVLLSTLLFFSSTVLAEQSLLGRLSEQATKESIAATVPNASKNVESLKSLVKTIKRNPETVVAGKEALNNLKDSIANTPSEVKDQAKQKATQKVLGLLNKQE